MTKRPYQDWEVRRRDRRTMQQAIATSEAYTDSMETQTRGWASDEFYTRAQSDSFYLRKANNLSDLANPATGRTNLGLGNSAVRDVGTIAGTVMAGDRTFSFSEIVAKPTTISGYGIVDAFTQTLGDVRYPLKANNLSDLGSIPTARTNLGLGDSATRNVGTTAGTVMAGDGAYVKADVYTKAESNANYYNKSVTYTKTEIDALIGSFLTQAQGDARYNRLAFDNTWTARNFMPNGSAASPSMAYAGSNTTGFYAPANAGVAVSVGGSQASHWRLNGGVVQWGTFGVTPVPRQSITGLLSILNLSVFNTVIQAGVNLGFWTDNRIL